MKDIMMMIDQRQGEITNYLNEIRAEREKMQRRIWEINDSEEKAEAELMQCARAQAILAGDEDPGLSVHTPLRPKEGISAMDSVSMPNQGGYRP